jgi:hypothetical protein
VSLATLKPGEQGCRWYLPDSAYEICGFSRLWRGLLGPVALLDAGDELAPCLGGYGQGVAGAVGGVADEDAAWFVGGF